MKQKKLTFQDKRRLLLVLLERQSRGLPIPKFDDFASITSDWGVTPAGYFVRDDGATYEPSDQQEKFILSTARFSAFYGPRGSGKTAAGAQKALRKIMAGEPGAVMNPDMENFKFSTWPELRLWIPWNMVVPRHRYRQSPEWEPTRPFTLVFTNKAKVVCKGLKDPDSARGPNINWLWYDEAGRDRTGMGWKLAIAGVRIGNSPQAWATYTPKDFYHWSYDFFVKQVISEEMKQLLKSMPEGYKLIEWFHGTRKDNETHLDPLFYASLESAYPGGYLRTQEVEGEYANEGGAIGTRAWFKDHYLDNEPDWADKKVRYWDLAASEKKIGTDPDETIGTLFSVDESKEKFCIENQVGGFWLWDRIKENIKTVARMDGTGVEVWVEQEPGSGGKNQVAEIKNLLKDEGFTVRGHNPKDDGDRVMAANTWFGEASVGKFYIVKGLWNDKFLIQLDTFPDPNLHDDRITSVSGARHVIAPIRKWKKMAFRAIGLSEKKPELVVAN